MIKRVAKKKISKRNAAEPVVAKSVLDEKSSDTRDEILAVATKEFADFGLSGARVDAIAELTRTSKRMIYYHFQSKEGLYRAVLEKVYDEIRTEEVGLNLQELTPVEAIRKIVELTFDHDETHPNFIRLVSVENIHRAENIKGLPSIRKRNATIINGLNTILDRGRAQGLFRKDVSALDVHLVISALCFFRASNRYTFGTVFDCNLSEPSLRKWHRQMIVDAVLRFLQPSPAGAATLQRKQPK